jgi:hypothetical protein
MSKAWLVALLLSACADASVPKPTAPTVLALGDSIAFGYNPVSDKDDPSAFISYGQLVADARHASLVNLACAGETSGSLISRTAADNGCGTWRQDHPLHVDYTTEVHAADPLTIAQLDAAVAYLQDPAQPTPELITIDIGANDLLLFAKACSPGDSTCLTGMIPTLLATVLPKTEANVSWTLQSLRGDGGYDGPIALVTTYALDYSDAVANFAVDDLDKVLRSAAGQHGVVIADAYAAFRDAANNGNACTAGLLFPLADGTCDIHPSTPATTQRPDGQSGAQVLADSILAAMN